MKEKHTFYITQADFAKELNRDRGVIKRAALFLGFKLKKMKFGGCVEKIWYSKSEYKQIKEFIIDREIKPKLSNFPKVIYVTETYFIMPSKLNYMKL